MSKYSLVATPVLGGFSRAIGNTCIDEITNLSIVSIAVPIGGEPKLTQALQQAYEAHFPKPGQSTVSQDQSVRFLGMASDQLFAVFEHEQDDGDLVVADRLGDTAYYTFQSDNWVVLRISGSLATTALGRICQIDLHSSIFPVHSVARTIMEHLTSIVIRESEESFMLLSPWSSAHSFAGALEHSLQNVATVQQE